jgi:hypothetical protein
MNVPSIFAASCLAVFAIACGRAESTSSGSTREASVDRPSNPEAESGLDARPEAIPEEAGPGLCAYTVTTCDGRLIRPPLDGSIFVGNKGEKAGFCPAACGLDGFCGDAAAGCTCKCILQPDEPDPGGPMPYCTGCVCGDSGTYLDPSGQPQPCE